MNPYFATFQKLFPLTGLKAEGNAMRRKFASAAIARHFEQRACEIILENGLPLTAAIETWSRKGVVFEINLVIEAPPEEYSFADEAGDDENLSGGWWNTKSE